MLEKIQEFISTIPKPVLIGVALLVVVAIFFIWKKFSSKDSENEVQRGAFEAQRFAEGVQRGLDRKDAPDMSTLTPGYAKEIQTGLQDLEEEQKPLIGAVAPGEDSDDDSNMDNYE
ncbi:hypothetical protein PBCVNEJV1_013L [Paramecium bursaria Chlorella virus NE-JV-1]|nr:hypothetical protein PBCVNEJV1_013L [Paramecium bursaria Chlorella virus NE-JV-1]